MISLPPDLSVLTDGYACAANNVGCTPAKVYRYHKGDNAFYLKIARADDEMRRERDLYNWLNGRLPVPEVKYWREQDGLAYLLTTEVPGRMTCDSPEDRVAAPVENTVRLLADGLLMLQAVDIADCPFDNTLDNKLAGAMRNIENGAVDTADWNDNNTFESPAALHNWLTANRPPEDLCFTHGDYCLPNVFIDGAAVTGFVDFGRGGIADKWQDIALCLRSLRYNLGDIEDMYIDLLFSRLGIAPDWEKINYYILLDELF